MNLSGSGNEQDYVVTLIHGTYARNADWVQEGSFFTQQLRKKLSCNVRFETFLWTGKNNHDARLAGGEALAGQLRQQIEEFPNAKHFLVGHSHGGNVAAYANKERDISEQMSGIIFLGTPFIHVRPRNVAMITANIFRILSFPLLMYALPVSILIGSIWVADQLLGNDGATTYFFLLCFSLFVGNHLYPHREIYRDVGAWLRQTICVRWRRKLKRRQFKLLQKLSPPQLDSHKLFVAAINYDEASIYLRILRVFSQISGDLLQLSVKPLRSLLILAIALIYVPLFILGVWYDGQYEDTYYLALSSKFAFGMIGIFAGIIITLMALSFIMPVIFQNHDISFGHLKPLDSFVINLFPHGLPHRTEKEVLLHFVEPQQDVRGLRHSSFYESADLVEAMADWMKQKS